MKEIMSEVSGLLVCLQGDFDGRTSNGGEEGEVDGKQCSNCVMQNIEHRDFPSLILTSYAVILKATCIYAVPCPLQASPFVSEKLPGQFKYQLWMDCTSEGEPQIYATQENLVFSVSG